MPLEGKISRDWLLGFFVSIVLPTLFTTLPPLIYPHIMSFVIPFGAFLILCMSFLLVGAAMTPRKESSMQAIPAVNAQESSMQAIPAPHSQPHSKPSTADPRDDDSNEPRSAYLHVVDLALLDAALSTQTAESVLTMLYTGDDLLTKVDVRTCTFAMISYRQERSKSDDFTLDVDAFRSAVARAHDAAVTALWLDAWCYRQQGAYDHSHFCRELETVMNHVGAIVWLPRSRTHAPPSYQFRLWCSFEASVVAYRRLPVHVAGVGMSASQRALRRTGIYLPALPVCAPHRLTPHS